MSKPINFTTDGELDISFTFLPGRRQTGEWMYSLGSPAEPAEIEDLCVGVIVKGRKIDITDLLNKAEIKHIEDLCFEDVCCRSERHA